MKKILITGANSYIGVSFEKYMEKFGDEYSVDTADMIGDEWKNKDFSTYSVVFHVAAVVHKKETKDLVSQYYAVNRDLAAEVAEKAKSDGVKQFIFLSSMSVYGIVTGKIAAVTEPKPKSHYGKSKLQAEQKLLPMNDDAFKVCVLRPPMIYGKRLQRKLSGFGEVCGEIAFLPVRRQRKIDALRRQSCGFRKTHDRQRRIRRVLPAKRRIHEHFSYG